MTDFSPEAEAVTFTVPAADGVVYVTLALPRLLVTTEMADRVPPAVPSLKVTVKPEIGLP